MHNEIKNLYAVYDFFGPHGYIPNAFNYFYAYKFFEEDGRINNIVSDHFFKNFIQIPVYNADLNLNSNLYKKLSFKEYNDIRIKDDKSFIYLVEPFGSFAQFLGKQTQFSEWNFIDFISDHAKKEIKNTPNFYLHINFSTEGVFEEHLIVYLYELLKRYEIPANKVVFTISSVDIEEIHNKICLENNINERINVIYWGWSLRTKSLELKRIHNNIEYNFWDHVDNTSTIVKEDDVDMNRIRPHKFLFMNRRLRPQRIILLSLLGSEFINQNLVSYDMKLFERENDLSFFSHHLKTSHLAINAFREFQNIFKSQRKTIDYDDLESVWGFNFENKEPYLDTYIHILSETNFYETGLYLSEKTWKPIGHLQPFIMVNKPGALKELHRLGFKTFTPFINESYDDIQNDTERMEFIYSEIMRLNSLSFEEIHEWYKSIWDILIYNRNLLFEYADNKDLTENDFLTTLRNRINEKAGKNNTRLV
jgi:hypothetical protein